jgi:hypothetical protein
MLRTIPKHKGTENLQADIKTRIKQLRDEFAGPKKGAHRTGPSHVIRAEGAAQVSLIGAPNVGKSSLHDRLTRSGAGIGVYPFTTVVPQPGMMAFEDIQFQLIDLPPVSVDFMENWYINALQPSDAALLVVDPGDPGCVEQVQAILNRLGEKKVTLLESWLGLIPKANVETSLTVDNSADDGTPQDDDRIKDPFCNDLPTLMVANKADLSGSGEELQLLQDLLGTRFPAMLVSSKTGDGLENLGPFLASALQIVRVYTRTPGKSTDLGRPFTVRHGGTVRDVAHLVHKDIAHSLKFARLWGGGQFAGQRVSAEYQVADGDIIELHGNS